MRAAYFLLLGLIGTSLALLVVDGPKVHGLIVAYAAVAVAFVGAMIRPGEAGHLARVIRPIAIIAALPLLWLIVQMIPLPVRSWAHPIWAAAETALGTPITSGITIDRGATLVAFCRYFSAIAILFVATAVTVDHMRAERVLFWLLSATTLAALVHIVHGFFSLEFLDPVTDIHLRVSTTALSALGAIMAATAVIHVIERHEMRRTETDVPFTKFAISLGPSLIAFGICAISLVIFSPAPVSLAAASGLATFVILMIVRRLGFGVWAGDAIAAVAIGIAVIVAIAIAESHAGSGDAMLRYASHPRSPLISITQRMIADAAWPGSGAGTFKSLLPIYGVSSTDVVAMQAPSTAAQIAIELGQPALWAIPMLVVVMLFLLSRGALQRGRDSYYPAAGAGCVIILMLEAFCDDSLFGTTVVICTMVALGLGFAQSVSRTINA